MNPEDVFDQLAAQFLPHPDVTPGTGFGSAPGLRIRGKIFAMLMRGDLVLKLPRDRVTELIASGTGAPFQSGQGRAMKEWVAISPGQADSWEELAREAYAFVGSLSAGSRGRRDR